MNLHPPNQLRVRISRILRCWMWRLRLLWTRSSEILTSRRRSVSRNGKPRKRTGFYEEDRSPSWSTTTFGLLALMIQYWTMLIYFLSLFGTIMFRNSIQDGMKFYCPCQRYIWLCPGKSLQIEDTWVWATQNCIRIVRDGGSSKDIGAQLSTIEDDGEKRKDQKLRLWNFDERKENRNRSSGQESKGHQWRWRRQRYVLPVERKKASVRRETSAVSDMRMTIMQQKPTPKSAPPSEPPMTRGRSASRKKKRQRQKSDWQNFFDNRADTIWKVLVRHHLVSIGILSNVNSFKLNRDAKQETMCLFPHCKVGKRCCSYCEKLYHSWVVSRKTQRSIRTSETREVSGKPRGVKSWDRSGRVRFTQSCATSRKNRLGQIQVKLPHQRSPYAVKFGEQISGKRLKRQRAMRPAARHGTLPENILQAQRKGQGCILFAYRWVEFASRIHQKKPAEREFCGWIPGQALAYGQQERTLKLCRIGKPWGYRRIRRRWWRPTARCKQEKRQTVYVKELDLFVTVMLLEETPAVSFSREALRGSWEKLTTGPAVKKPHLTQNGKRIYCKISKLCTIRSPLVYRRVSSTTPHTLLLHHLHYRILWFARKIQQQKEVRLRVRSHRENASRGSAENRKHK